MNLLLQGRKRGYRMTFDALPPSVVAGLGTLGVSGGALRATGIAVRGRNEVSNGEFTANTTGWSSESAATLTQRDSAVAPGAASPGADPGCIEVAGTSVVASASQTISLVKGSHYAISYLGYRPAGTDMACRAGFSNFTPATAVDTTETGAWQSRGRSDLVATNTTTIIQLYNRSAVGGALYYYDAISLQRQNAIAWMPPVGVNLSLPVALAMPAAPDVTPIDIIVRGADALNYWAVRLTPNTAGNDTQIIEVVAGVETVRAAADVDWTAGGTDYVLLDVRGTALTVYAMKQGASVWSPAASYATMATQLTSTGIGVQYYSTTAGPTLTDWAPRAS